MRLSRFLKTYSFLQPRYRMKHSKTLATLFAAILVVTVFCGNYSFADLNDAITIQSAFGSINGGNGFTFKVAEDKQGDKLISVVGKTPVDVTAYNQQAGRSGLDIDSGQDFFRSFCVEPNASIDGVLVGTLSYEYDTTKAKWITKTSEGVSLVLGAAILYKEFALNEMNGRSADTLREAILMLMSVQDYTISSWAQNEHLAYLYSISQHDGNSAGVWTATYDPGQDSGLYYDMLGDCRVFIMNALSEDDTLSDKLRERQDFLYIMQTRSDTDVPEPASILFWTLGGLGAAGTSWARKRRMKKLAAA